MNRPLTHIQIIEMIIANPPSNITVFARKVGCPRRVMHRIVRELEAAGMIPPRQHSRSFLWEQALEDVLKRTQRPG